MRFLRFSLAFVIGFIFVSSVFAQVEVPTPNPNAPIDFSPLINQAIGLVVIVLGGVATWAGVALRGYFAAKGILVGQQAEDVFQSRYDQASLLALSLFESMLRKTGMSWSEVNIDNPFLKDAAHWMMKNWPDVTKDKDLLDVIHSLYARMPSGEMTDKALEFSKVKAAAVGVKANA